MLKDASMIPETSKSNFEHRFTWLIKSLEFSVTLGLSIFLFHLYQLIGKNWLNLPRGSHCLLSSLSPGKLSPYISSRGSSPWAKLRYLECMVSLIYTTIIERSLNLRSWVRKATRIPHKVANSRPIELHSFGKRRILPVGNRHCVEIDISVWI